MFINWLTDWLGCLLNHFRPSCTKASGAPGAPCSTSNHRWPSSPTFICVFGHWSMFTSVRFIHLHVHFEWSRPRISFYSVKLRTTMNGECFWLMLYSKRKKEKKLKGLNGVCIYKLCFWHVWGLVFLIHKRTVDSIICIDDCLQSCSREMLLLSLQPSSLITLLMCRIVYF